MKTLNDLVKDCTKHINEIMPWDLEEKLASSQPPLIVDIREQNEYETMHIACSIFAPRGILESCCDYDYDETIPELASARDKEIVLVCRSGNRTALAAYTMQLMGFTNVLSLKTGLKGWNEYDQPLIDIGGNEVDPDNADDFFATILREDQKSPNS
ncbi:MAG: rhodanese-like domain-containing protein [Gammaproteobacteria bacterium]|nr:rhodanese-like domain-containing protein [Gammaproteobacteria bacterium]